MGKTKLTSKIPHEIITNGKRGIIITFVANKINEPVECLLKKSNINETFKRILYPDTRYVISLNYCESITFNGDNITIEYEFTNKTSSTDIHPFSDDNLISN